MWKVWEEMEIKMRDIFGNNYKLVKDLQEENKKTIETQQHFEAQMFDINVQLQRQKTLLENI